MKRNAPIAPRRLVANDAYTFLMRELEKVDEKILEPLTSVDWPRDMPVITGGGLVESISSIDVTYASAGDNGNVSGDNLLFESANQIPVIQADMSKSVAKTFNFAEYMSFTIMEKEKMMQVGRDPEVFLNKGIRLHCDKYIDTNVYRGFRRAGSTGLVNTSYITRTSAQSHTPGGTDTDWASKTAEEILNDINTAISGLWRDNDCSSDAIPNHILVPVEQFGLLVTMKLDDSGKSVLTYVLENNLAKQLGVDLVISPCKWCKEAGSGQTDRMIVYCNQEDRICFNLTQPLRRMDTEYAEMRIKVPYIAQFSEVRFLYPTTVRYMDGI